MAHGRSWRCRPRPDLRPVYHPATPVGDKNHPGVVENPGTPLFFPHCLSPLALRTTRAPPWTPFSGTRSHQSMPTSDLSCPREAPPGPPSSLQVPASSSRGALNRPRAPLPLRRPPRSTASIRHPAALPFHQRGHREPAR